MKYDQASKETLEAEEEAHDGHTPGLGVPVTALAIRGTLNKASHASRERVDRAKAACCGHGRRSRRRDAPRIADTACVLGSA